MVDFSQPISWQIIVGTIFLILVITAYGIFWVNKKTNKENK